MWEDCVLCSVLRPVVLKVVMIFLFSSFSFSSFDRPSDVADAVGRAVITKRWPTLDKLHTTINEIHHCARAAIHPTRPTTALQFTSLPHACTAPYAHYYPTLHRPATAVCLQCGNERTNAPNSSSSNSNDSFQGGRSCAVLSINWINSLIDC